MWRYNALLSAQFAALTAVLAKIGLRGVDSNLATAVRTTVVLLLSWGIVCAAGSVHGLRTIGRTSWVFLLLSGLATGLSWLCYFKALSLGDVSRVAPVDKLSVVFVILFALVVLREPATPRVLLGGALIAAGSFVLLLK